MVEYEICKICGITFEEDEFKNHLIEKHTKGILKLKPATSVDIVLGKKIIYPKISHSVNVERIIDVNDNCSAFISENQRYGLNNAYIEVFKDEDATMFLEYEDLQYIFAKESLKELIKNFGKGRWFTSFELPKVSKDMLYLLEKIYYLERIKVNNITYYKCKYQDECCDECGQYYNEGIYQ